MPGQKIYYQIDNVGTAKYSILYHNGVKKHRDGSPFFDIAIFRNKKKLNTFIRDLKAKGYKERGLG